MNRALGCSTFCWAVGGCGLNDYKITMNPHLAEVAFQHSNLNCPASFPLFSMHAKWQPLKCTTHRISCRDTHISSSISVHARVSRGLFCEETPGEVRERRVFNQHLAEHRVVQLHRPTVQLPGSGFYYHSYRCCYSYDVSIAVINTTVTTAITIIATTF